MSKYPKVTITESQYNYIKELLKSECVARVQDKACEYIYKKSVHNIKDCYCSNEWQTILYIVRAIAGNYNNRLNILMEV